MRRRPLPRWFAPVAIVVGLGVLLLIGWLADTARANGEVMRNVTVEGVAVGGLTRDQLEQTVEDLSKKFAAVPVEVQAGETKLSTTTEELGLVIDRVATTESAMRVGRNGLVFGQLSSWLRSFSGERQAPVVLTVIPAQAEAWVTKVNQEAETIASEPGFSVIDGKIVAVEGKVGVGVDPADVAKRLRSVIYSGTGTVNLSVKALRREPKGSKVDAEKLIEEATRITASPLAVRAGGASTTVSVAQLRSWLASATKPGGGLQLALDPVRVRADLAQRLAAGSAPATDARFDVQAGKVVVVPGADGAACCAANVGDVVLAALRARPPDAVTLPMAPKPSKVSADDLAALGVKEVVGQFTTYHPAGQPRVVNIHRMADLVRGQVIAPNTTLSINKLIGPRTADKGFVPAPAIGDGNLLSPEVGGGISQFMTTFFNAAFFAGLDYGDYQSHSLYISRYPYGREATINWPAPDLQIKNTTPYSVLVWPTYDDKSLTVTLYSTKFLAKVEQTDQIKTPYLKSCTDVKTERTRTYLDGRVVKDYIRARYNLKEGLVCADPPDATPRTTTTTAKPGATTVKGATTAPKGPTTTKKG